MTLPRPKSSRRRPFHFESLEGRDLMAALTQGVKVNDLANATIFDAQTTANVATSPNGNIYVAYGGANGVRVATSSNRGASFAKSVRLSTATADSVAIAVSGDEDVFAAWTAGGKLYVSRSVNDGASFGAATLVTSNFFGTIDLAVEGNNVYVSGGNGSPMFANTNDAIGRFTAIPGGSGAFSHLLTDPTTGDLYQVTDSPGLVARVSVNRGTGFTNIPLSGAGDIYYSSVAASFGDQGKFAFTAGGNYDVGTEDDAFRIDLTTGQATPLVFGSAGNYQGRDLAADGLGNVVDSYFNNGQIRYRVSQDLGNTFGTEISVATGLSSNIAINAAYQDIVVVYQVGGNLFLSVFGNELLTSFDFGDAPASYGTTLAGNGARHVTGDLYLGAGVDVDANGLPTADATGDNLDNTDDEEGVSLPGQFIAGQASTVTVVASQAGKLDGWFDLNRNGKFEANEKILNSVSVVAGANQLSVNLPTTALTGNTFARFRVSSAGGLSATGYAADGEVEDYAVNVFGGGDVLIQQDSHHHDVLTINSTTNSDAVAVQMVPGSTTHVRVVGFGKTFGPFALSSFDSIEIQGYAGNDSISIDPKITKPVVIHGGDGNDSIVGGGGQNIIYGEGGNDTIKGGAAVDIILGGLGNDSILGGAGRDLLIGGSGVDSLNGEGGDDIVIGGNTTHDNDQDALLTIASAWNANTSFDNRRGDLAGLLNSTTVQNDNAKDSIFGGADRDWMLDYALLDLFLDFNSNAQTGDRKN